MNDTDTKSQWLPAAVAVLALVVVSIQPIQNPDTFGHLAAGRQIAELGFVPGADTFSFHRETPQPWTNYEWLSDLLTFAIWDTTGSAGLLILKLLLVGVTAYLITLFAYKLGGLQVASLSTALVMIAVPAIKFRLSMRPHLFGFVLAAALLLLLNNVATQDRKRWIINAVVIGALHVLWVNLHGSHLIGLLFTCVFIVAHLRDRDIRKRLLVVLGYQVIASCVSPYGPAIVIDALHHVADPRYAALVTEWAPWGPDCLIYWLVGPIIQSLLLLAVAPRLYREGPIGRALLGIACILAFMAFRSVRFVGEFLLLSSPIVAWGVASITAEWSKWRKHLLQAIAGIASIAMLSVAVVTLPPRLGMGVDTSHLPSASAQWLREHAQDARVLAPMRESWYLMFAVPNARFLLDGRIPFYGPEHTQMIQQALGSPHQLDLLLRRFPVDTVVLRLDLPAQAHTINLMQQRDQFELVSIEAHHALFRRRLETSAPESRRALRVLYPSYDPLPFFAVEPTAAQVEAELDLLPEHPNTTPYRSWIQALMLLRPLVRDRGRAGLRPPTNPQEVTSVRQAASRLADLEEEIGGLETVVVWRAMAEAVACDLDQAQSIIDSLTSDERSRETVLVEQEISLRRGNVEEVTRLLDQASSHEQFADDPWITALRAMLESPPRCDTIQ